MPLDPSPARASKIDLDLLHFQLIYLLPCFKDVVENEVAEFTNTLLPLFSLSAIVWPYLIILLYT